MKGHYWISSIWNIEFPDWYILDVGLEEDNWYKLIIARADRTPAELYYKDNVVKVRVLSGKAFDREDV